MKTKKSLEKKEIKTKSNKSHVLRNDSKVKPKSIQSSERLCNRCKVHGTTLPYKGHKCPNIDCRCVKCLDLMEKNRRRNEQVRQRLVDKKANKDKPKTDNSFANSLKNKSKKILNNIKDKTTPNGSTKKTSKDKKKKKTIRTTSGSPNCGTSNTSKTQKERRGGHMNSPPRLVLQQPMNVNEPQIDIIEGNSSSTDVDVIHSNAVDDQPVPEKSSAALCAQYLNSCAELSRKLSKYQFTEDELIASLKYFIVRQSLGDIERAAQDIICASQEIRLGASYMVQHPGDMPNTSVGQTSTTSVRQPSQAQQVNVNPPVLCSTFNPNFRANDGPTYSPAFTPIRNNN